MVISLGEILRKDSQVIRRNAQDAVLTLEVLVLLPGEEIADPVVRQNKDGSGIYGRSRSNKKTRSSTNASQTKDDTQDTDTSYRGENRQGRYCGQIFKY